MKIVILLSTYNGTRYLREQLDSLLRQKLPDDFSLEILVRDDGSTDNTAEILNEYGEDGIVKWYAGENIGVAKSFWNLVNSAPQADYYAFCDQDDVWLDDKVARAINALEDPKGRRIPLLYCSNVTVTDSELNAKREMNSGDVCTTFEHALLCNIAPGCTFVFNNIAREYLRKYDMERDGIVIHDWLAFKIVAMLGQVVYDGNPTMLYRQHDNNVIGATDNSKKLKTFFSRIKHLFSNESNQRSRNAKRLLEIYSEDASETARHAMDVVANYRKKRSYKKELLNSDLYPTKVRSNLKWGIRLNII